MIRLNSTSPYPINNNTLAPNPFTMCGVSYLLRPLGGSQRMVNGLKS